MKIDSLNSNSFKAHETIFTPIQTIDSKPIETNEPKTFEDYLVDFSPQTPLHDIPEPIRQKLLMHFQALAELNQKSIDSLDSLNANGVKFIPLIPRCTFEKILDKYNLCIENLIKSLVPKITFVIEADSSNIDPRYYWLRSKQPELFSEGAMLPVQAMINDLEAWKNLTNVQVRSEIKMRGDWIVTANIPADKFKEISQLPFVLLLELPTSVMIENT